jgi:probable DNA repair protein
MLTQRLLVSAEEVVISYPRQGERSEELGPSPLIADFRTAEQTELALWRGPTWKALVAEQTWSEWLNQDRAPALQDKEAGGGSGLFKAQAACPFRAFAEYRLAAKPFARPEPGLDAMARGSLIHRALELVWEDLESHQHLLAQMRSGALEESIRNAAEQALKEFGQQFSPVMTKGFRDLELQRVQRQLRQWLEVEVDRKPFHVVGREVPLTPEIGGLRIKLTVDRIDQLEDGRVILIDYKTGVVQPSQWFGDRPEEPQLPLYSAVVEGEKAAVLFAQIRLGESLFRGVVAEKGLIPGLPPVQGARQLKESTETWPLVIDEWSRIMNSLARDFRAGKALVDPKRQPDSCSYCELSALCRIDEQNGLRLRNPSVEEA